MPRAGRATAADDRTAKKAAPAKKQPAAVKRVPAKRPAPPARQPQARVPAEGKKAKRSQSRKALEKRLAELTSALYMLDQRVLFTSSRTASEEAPSVDFALRPVVFEPWADGTPKFYVSGQLTVVNDAKTRYRVVVALIYCSDLAADVVPLDQDVIDEFALGLGGLQVYDFAQRQVRLLAAMHERETGLPGDVNEVDRRLLPDKK